jgi:hypothetical protein
MGGFSFNHLNNLFGYYSQQFLYSSQFMLLEKLAISQIDWKTPKHAIDLLLLFIIFYFNKLVFMPKVLHSCTK